MKTLPLLHRLISLTLAILLVIPPPALLACANNTPGGPPGPCPTCPDQDESGNTKQGDSESPEPAEEDEAQLAGTFGAAGMNHFRVAGGNHSRKITDLEVWGGAGQHQLNFTRHAHSRGNPNTAAEMLFGEGHGWRHNYQWTLAIEGTQRVLYYPDGTIFSFTKSGTNWNREASCPDTLVQDGLNFVLTRPGGGTYYFQRLQSSTGSTYYQMQRFEDGYGNLYTLTYDADNRVTSVTEPTGRFLQLAYQSSAVDLTRFTTLATIMSKPAESQWTDVTVTNTRAFRYLRYHSASMGYGNVAEVEFYTRNAQGQEVKLTGTPFGATPYLNGDTAYSEAAAFDGNPSTWYHFGARSGGFVGLDLGAGNEQKVTKIRYLPRAGYASRMTSSVGTSSKGRFEGGNTAPEVITTIASVTASDGRSVTYNYSQSPDSVIDYTWVSLSGVSYGDNLEATYTYAQIWPGVRPFLETAIDPMLDGPGSEIKFEYRFNDHITGNIAAEYGLGDPTPVLTLDSTDAEKPVITYANGAVHKYTASASNAASRVTKVVQTPQVGSNASRSSAASGSAASQSNPVGGVVSRSMSASFATSGEGYQASYTDAKGGVTSYGRSPRGRLLSKTFPDGALRHWTRDSKDRILTYTDELGQTTTYTRDARGRTTRVDHPGGLFEEYTYDFHSHLLTHRWVNGGVQSYTYNAEGLRETSTNPLGHTTTYTYDASDRLASVTDPLGHVATYERNQRGHVTRLFLPDGMQQAFTYEPHGKPTQVQRIGTDGSVHTWTLAYDHYQRLVASTDPLQRTTTRAYEGLYPGCCGGGAGNASSNPTLITFPSGRMVGNTYDSEWRRTGVTEGYGTPDAATTAYEYDAADNLVKLTDPLGRVWTATYDTRDRATKVTDPLGSFTHYSYDAKGRESSTTTPSGSVTTRTYDPQDRLRTIADAKNQITSYTYETLLDKVTQIDAKGNATQFQYDKLGQRTRKTYANGSHEDWTNNAVGNVANYTTASGKQLTFYYDVADRLLLKDWSDATPDVAYTYDPHGRVATAVNSVSGLSYTYNAASEVLSETQDLQSPIDLAPTTVTYTYDADGRRASLGYPSGKTATYGHTSRGQLASVNVDGPPPLATYTYDLAGRRIGKSLENGTIASYSYDAADRLINLVHQKGANVLQSFVYEMNADGLRTARIEAGAVFGPGVSNRDSYSYDATDQLSQVQYGHIAGTNTTKRQTSYNYDALGNRLDVKNDPDGSGPTPTTVTTFTANNLNLYEATGSLVPPTYDQDGNTTRLQSRSGGATWEYQYDAQNRLVAGVSSTGGTFSFSYDPWNRCVVRDVDSTVWASIYQGWSLLEDRSVTGAQIAEYYLGAEVDEVLATVSMHGISYHHHDGLGNVASLTGGDGNTTEHYTYDAYGAPTIYGPSGAPLAESPSGNRLLFTGREYFHSLGLQDNRHRYYAPDLGRWLSRDPIGERGGLNLYAYVDNDPLNRSDTLGLWGSLPPPPAVLGAAGAGATATTTTAAGAGAASVAAAVVLPIVAVAAWTPAGQDWITNNIADPFANWLYPTPEQTLPTSQAGRNERGQPNYLNLDAKRLAQINGTTECEELAEMWKNACKANDSKKKLEVKKAQKAAGCRHSNK